MKTLSPGRDDKYLRCPSKRHVPIVSKLSRSFLLLFDKSKLFCNAISCVGGREHQIVVSLARLTFAFDTHTRV